MMVEVEECPGFGKLREKRTVVLAIAPFLVKFDDSLVTEFQERGQRDGANHKNTIGQLHIDGVRYCDASSAPLNRVVRHFGISVVDHAARSICSNVFKTSRCAMLSLR